MLPPARALRSSLPTPRHLRQNRPLSTKFAQVRTGRCPQLLRISGNVVDPRPLPHPPLAPGRQRGLDINVRAALRDLRLLVPLRYSRASEAPRGRTGSARVGRGPRGAREPREPGSGPPMQSWGLLPPGPLLGTPTLGPGVSRVCPATEQLLWCPLDRRSEVSGWQHQPPAWRPPMPPT